MQAGAEALFEAAGGNVSGLIELGVELVTGAPSPGLAQGAGEQHGVAAGSDRIVDQGLAQARLQRQPGDCGRGLDRLAQLRAGERAEAVPVDGLGQFGQDREQARLRAGR